MARLHLFVSIDPRMDAEREAIALAIARFPVLLGWLISYTPEPDEGVGLDSGSPRRASFVAAVLGIDVKAPMGWELMVARSVGLRPMAFARRVGRTLAARAFHRDSRLEWTEFESASELGFMFQRQLAQRLAANPAAYDLTTVELQTLHGFLEGERDVEPAGADPVWEGAGRGGVILSPEHDIPEGAVLLGRDGARQEGDHE